MPAAFITYYEALAKLNQVANKQTMFLAHVLYHMDFDKKTRQYLVDISTSKKKRIMKEISPTVKEESLLNLANQYSLVGRPDVLREIQNNYTGASQGELQSVSHHGFRP
jgi:hypothetical protein